MERSIKRGVLIHRDPFQRRGPRMPRFARNIFTGRECPGAREESGSKISMFLRNHQVPASPPNNKKGRSMRPFQSYRSDSGGISFTGCGQGRIRTFVDSRRQIYSLLPLTTRPPTLTIIYKKHRAIGGIRTPDPLITNQLLWPTELQWHNLCSV